jgi:hypothetical protein
MGVNLQRRIAFVAALIIPAVAVLVLSASPALAALPRHGRLVLGTRRTEGPLAILIIALGTAAGLGLVAINARRRPHVQNAAASTIPFEASSPTDAANGGRKAA